MPTSSMCWMSFGADLSFTFFLSAVCSFFLSLFLMFCDIFFIGLVTVSELPTPLVSVSSKPPPTHSSISYTTKPTTIILFCCMRLRQCIP